MSELATTALGVFVALVLIVLPGAWISFGLALPGTAFWLRFCTGCVLSPLLAVIQFYALRLCGLSFDACVPALALINLPALWFIRKRLRDAHMPRAGDLAISLCVLAIPVACLLLPAILQPVEYPYWLHSWLHSGTMYLLANGQLLPEESHLAGVAQSYPWAAHIFQGLLSRALDLPPAVTYLAFNAVWMLLVTAFVGGLVRELGGGARARVAAWILLWFGVNFVGYFLRWIILDPDWETKHLFHGELFGDVRYTPWLWKFRFMEHIVFGMAMFAALPHYLMRVWKNGAGVAQDLAVVLLLLTGQVLLYPVLAPAGFGLVSGCALLFFIARWRKREPIPTARFVQLAGILLVSGLIGLAYFKTMLAERHYGTGGLAGPRDMARKAAQTVIVALPLLIAAAFYLRGQWRTLPRLAEMLVLGALFSIAFYVGVTLPAPNGEYKHMFTTAICLAPLAGVAVEPLLVRAGRAWGVVAFVACLVLGLPFMIKIYKHWGWPPGGKPALELSHFDLTLAPSVPGASVYVAIREQTPKQTIAVVDAPKLDVTALTRRPMYSFDDEDEMLPGVMILTKELMYLMRGHDRAIVQGRMKTQADLFRGNDGERAAALEKILALRRPLAILIDAARPGHVQLLEWLEHSGRGHAVARDGALTAWLVESVER